LCPHEHKRWGTVGLNLRETTIKREHQVKRTTAEGLPAWEGGSSVGKRTGEGL